MTGAHHSLRPAALAAALLGSLLPARAAAGELTQKYLCEDAARPFFSFQELPGGARKASNAREFSEPSSFLLPKPAGVFRTFIIGESAAAILGGAKPLTRALASAIPGAAPETMNCGMGAYESSRILAVAREVLNYSPDLLVVLSGNNEGGWAEVCPGVKHELSRRHRLLRSRLGALSLPREEADIKVSMAVHESRLREIAAAARSAGVPLVLCTLPVNLRDMAPAGNPPPALPRALGLISAGRHREALETLNAPGLERDAFAHFYAGRALEAMDRKAEAAERYGLAVKYDKAGDRSSPERNRMIRRVAAEEGACLADLEKEFAGVAEGGLTGGREIADNVHWFDRYDPFVLEAIAEAAVPCLPKALGASAPDRRRRAPQREEADDFNLTLSFAVAHFADRSPSPGCADFPNERLITGLERACRLDCRRMLRALSGPGEFSRELRRGRWNRDLPEEAGPWLRAVTLNAAEMLERAGRKGDAAALRSGLSPAGPADACQGRPRGGGAGEIIIAPGERPPGEKEGKAFSDEAVKKIGEGDLAGAKELLEKAVRAFPDGAEQRLNACYLAARTGDRDFGTENCDMAVALGEDPPKHSLPAPFRLADALYSRANFRKSAGLPGACEDLKSAAEKGGAGWPSAEAAAETLKAACR